VRDGDLDLIAGSLDWLGVNYYTPHRVAADNSDGSDQSPPAFFPGAPPFRFAPREPRTSMGWEIEPG